MSKGWSQDSAAFISGASGGLLLVGLTGTAEHGKAAGDSLMRVEAERQATEARIETVKSSLRQLVISEEEYFADNVRYTTVTACSAQSRGAILCVPDGVRIGSIKLTNDGWSATMTHDSLPGLTCAIFIGSTPVRPAKTEGLPTCQ